MRVFSAVPLLTCAFLHFCAGIALPKIPTPATSALILREPVHSEHESYFSTSPSIMSPSNTPTSASLRKKDQEVPNDESHRRPHEAWPTLAEDIPQTPSRRSNDEGGNPPFERDSPIPGPTERGLTSPTAWKLEKNKNGAFARGWTSM
ncbi:hypothetical protein B0T09DRAFT_367222 [Sordaria sp. MPI-SDFR-AT-0083]|nr:hypothetical protein B0T09DRAFT_367222 [Sordaria sp. MPI-SDFR-AT-0083]